MQATLFSVSYAGFWGQATLALPGFVDKAADLGYEAVMFMGKRPHLSVLDTTAGQLADLKKQLIDRGLTYLGTAGYTNFTAGTDCKEVPFVEMQLHTIQRLTAMTAELGGSQIRVFTGYRTSEPPAQEWNQCVEALRACGEIAAQFDLTIGVQNHHDVALDTRALKMLVDEIDHPAVRPSYDCWSPYLRGEDFGVGAKAMAAATINTICADYVVLPSFRYRPEYVDYERENVNLVRAVPMGEGDLDYSTFFAGLRAGGYDGPVTYEMCSPLQGGGSMENLDRCAKAFLAYMQRIWT